MNIPTKSRRPSFTLIEMTIVMAIIGILAAMAMSVYATALSQSKAHRTRAIIAKIDQLIGEKYESYRTRQVPIRIPPNWTPAQAAVFRLNAIRELMRMEMPDRMTDIFPYDNNPNTTLSGDAAVLPAIPSLTKNYRRRILGTWNNANDNAECLYLILAAMRDGDKSALDYFSTTEIGDTDGDQMNEILDAWGQPIAFLRWAPAYRADIAPFPVTPQTAADPDPFDPLKVDYRWRDVPTGNEPFALKPLIWSAGSDKRHGINVGTPNDPMTGVSRPYVNSTPPNDPYMPDTILGIPTVGAPVNEDYTDNITNHDLEAR